MHGRRECDQQNLEQMPSHSAYRNGCMGCMYINGKWNCPWQKTNIYTVDIKPSQYHLFSPRERMLHISNSKEIR